MKIVSQNPKTPSEIDVNESKLSELVGFSIEMIGLLANADLIMVVNR